MMKQEKYIYQHTLLHVSIAMYSMILQYLENEDHLAIKRFKIRFEVQKTDRHNTQMFKNIK